MAHIPRADIEFHRPRQHQYEEIPGPDQPPRQRQHQYEETLGLDQPVFYSQQQQLHILGSNPCNLEVGSKIIHGNSPAHSGTIKWIGYLPETSVLSAGLEMVCS